MTANQLLAWRNGLIASRNTCFHLQGRGEQYYIWCARVALCNQYRRRQSKKERSVNEQKQLIELEPGFMTLINGHLVERMPSRGWWIVLKTDRRKTIPSHDLADALALVLS
jgi:hypothetical protein